jgi:uncharacterized membrane protein YfcA
MVEVGDARNTEACPNSLPPIVLARRNLGAGFSLRLLSHEQLQPWNHSRVKGKDRAFAHSCYHTRVSAAKLVLLIAICFVTSVISVVTGSTSLITIPAMISLGLEPHVAIATNMLALTLMCVGGTVPFVGKGTLLTGERLYVCIVLTLVGSTLGALLVLTVPFRALQIIIAVAMISVAAFTIRNGNLGVTEAPPSRAAERIGYAATFFLAVYGGFFSGGYVTLLTTAFVVLLGMNFLQAVANTKLMNVFSSGVATLIFLWRGIVDVRLGIILGIAMFFGALLGGRIVMLLSAVWLRRMFLAAVFALAINMLWLLH